MCLFLFFSFIRSDDANFAKKGNYSDLCLAYIFVYIWLSNAIAFFASLNEKIVPHIGLRSRARYSCTESIYESVVVENFTYIRVYLHYTGRQHHPRYRTNCIISLAGAKKRDCCIARESSVCCKLSDKTYIRITFIFINISY